jgi:hypothetical protein
MKHVDAQTTYIKMCTKKIRFITIFYAERPSVLS